VHPQSRDNFWPATATTGVHVEPKRIPLVTGVDRFPAWLVTEKFSSAGSPAFISFAHVLY
jgi:hypothetical protein